jgi:hypothetical protein
MKSCVALHIIDHNKSRGSRLREKATVSVKLIGPAAFLCRAIAKHIQFTRDSFPQMKSASLIHTDTWIAPRITYSKETTIRIAQALTGLAAFLSKAIAKTHPVHEGQLPTDEIRFLHSR